MITLITGVPGSAKSYYAVYYVNSLSKEAQQKVIHNIEGLKLGTSLDQYSLDSNISKTDIFRKSFHENNNSLYGYLFIIDEAAEFFPKNFRDIDIISFFDYHRHYGLDIILLTQDIKKISPDISCLAENHYRAASSAANIIPFYFTYRQIIGGEKVSTKYLRKKKEIFALYKSSNNLSSGTLNIGKIYIVLIFLTILFIIFSGYSWLKSRKNKIEQLQKSEVALDSKKNSNRTKIFPDGKINSPDSSNYNTSSSLSSSLGGNPYLISSITDYSGVYYIIKGLMIRKELFPYKVVKSRAGLQALLPDNVYKEVLEYDKNLEISPKDSFPAQPAAGDWKQASADKERP